MDLTKIYELLNNPAFKEARKSFNFLGLDDLVRLMSIGKLQHVSKNEHFVREGEFSKKVGFIIKGLVRLYHLKDGEEYNLIFKQEFQLIASFESVILNQPSSYSFEALEDTTLIVYDYAKMEKLFEKHPKLERFGRYFMQHELAMAIKVFEKHLFFSPEDRYLKFIEENPQLLNRVPLKHLASFLGVTPVSLSRIRKRVAESRD